MKHLFPLIAFSISSSAYALTYDEAVQTALDHSHDIKILKLQSESASLSKTKARSGFLPKVELNARHLFSERFEELEVSFGGQTLGMPAVQPYTSSGITAQWTVFDGFKNRYELQAAGAEESAAERSLERARDEKRVQIRSLFSRALASQILVQVANQNIDSLQSHLGDIDARIRSGVATRFDSLRTEVQLEEARTEKLSAQNAVATSRARLFEALGVPDDGKSLEGELTKEFVKVNPSKVERKIEERKDRAVLLARESQAESLAKASRSHWMPTVALFGNYEWYNNINHSVTASDERFKSAYGLGIMVKWNLFDGGARYADHRKAILAQQIAEETLARFDQSSSVQAEEIRNKFSYDLVNYQAKLSNVRKAEEAVRLAKGGLRAGTRTNTEVLDAVVDLNRARAAAVKSQVEAIEDLGQLELTYGVTL